MSHIWTQTERRFKFSTISRNVFRAVESQHKNSTRKLVNTDADQETLEREIERVKPATPEWADKSLHWLLWSPFRYPPLFGGSRFGSSSETSIWYGSFEVRTALAEKAYWKWKFLQDSEADISPLQEEFTVFFVRISSSKVADLTGEIFKKFRKSISEPSNYSETQPLGSVLRERGTEVIKFFSVRDQKMKGINVGLFRTDVFAEQEPNGLQTWTLYIHKLEDEASCRSHSLEGESITFTKSDLHFS